MPAWVTIYLQRVPSDLSPEAIKAGIADADWWTLAEEFEIDEDEVDAFFEQVRWNAEPLEIQFEGRRPLQFHVWTDPDRLREEIAELDQIAGLVVPNAVREHLRAVRCIVALEVGFSQLETMFEVVAFEIAYWLAETSGGVIKGFNDAWFDHAAHRWNPLTD